MGAEIERIVDRKTIRGRVHYLVVWRGFGEDSNTWESRMDLVADGYANVIREFEHGRKGQDGDEGSASRSRSKSPGRARGRSRSNSTPRSPSAGRRGRKPKAQQDKDGESSEGGSASANGSESTSETTGETKTVRKRATKKEKADDLVVSEKKTVKKTVKRTVKDDKKKTQSQTQTQTHVAVAYEATSKKSTAQVGEQLELEPVKEPSEGDADADAERVSKWQALVRSGGLMWIFSALVVVGSLVASQYLPVLGWDEASSPWRLWIPVLTPVIALLLAFREKDVRASIKWVAIGLAWRVAGELLFVVGDSAQTYWKIALGSLVIANAAFAVAVATIIRKREHARSTATFAVYVLGVLALLLSDSWILQGTLPAAHTRTTLMAVAVLTISLSPMLTTAPKDDN